MKWINGFDNSENTNIKLYDCDRKDKPVVKFNELLLSAQGGDIDSQYELGSNYLLGIEGVNKDVKQAEYWLTEAALHGSLISQAQLGALYIREKDDVNRGVACLQKAAEGGITEAEYNLGLYYESFDAELALYWYSKAAQKGDQDARKRMSNLGKKNKMLNKDYILYTVLAFMLGTLGVHDFYAGKTKSAVIHIILTLTILGIPFSSVWAMVQGYNSFTSKSV